MNGSQCLRLTVQKYPFSVLILAIAVFGVPKALAVPFPTDVFVNELHYDNVGTDANEAIEIAGPAGTDLTGWNLVLYNGANGLVYDTNPLTGVISNQQNGYGTLAFNYASNGIQNGSPDGIALVNSSSNVMQFLSYEGTFSAVNGPASGLTSTDIRASESSTTPLLFSLQLTGTGTFYENFSWLDTMGAIPNSFNSVNTGQTFGTTGTNVFINELHYDNVGTDSNEGIEIAGPSGTDLTGWSIVLYNGANGLVYDSTALGGVISNQQNGYGTLAFHYASNGIQNGAPDGIALLDNNGNLVEFICYEGTFTAANGPAAGVTCSDINVREGSTTPELFSLQLAGVGSILENFHWLENPDPILNTFDAVNTGQMFYAAQTTPAIPESSTILLLGVGLVGLGYAGRRKLVIY